MARRFAIRDFLILNSDIASDMLISPFIPKFARCSALDRG